MARFHPKVLTANALASGEVIYRTADGGWCGEHMRAELIEDEALAEERLAEAKDDIALVGPYLADAIPSPGGPQPVHFREAFRTRGPSNYFHGKQEDASHA